jgi:PAS domain S-box-containing protein
VDGILNIPAREIRLTLRTKMLALIGLLLIGLIIVLSILSQTILLDSFADLEEKTMRRNTRRVLSAMNNDLADLNTLTADWTHRDETAAFVKDGNADFIQKNLTPSTFTTLKLNLALFFDASGSLVFGQAFDFENNIAVPISGRLIDLYLASDSLLSHYTRPTDTGSYVSGVVVTPEGPILIAIQPVPGPGGQSPAQGTLIFGRLLDEAMTKALAESTGVSLELHYFEDPQLPADFARAHQALVKGAGVVVAPLDPGNIAGYVSINDISGNPALILRAETPRDIYGQGQKSVGFFLLAALGVGLMMSAALLLLIEREVLTRLLRLSVAVRRIGATGDATARLPVRGRDELASLAESINGMLAAVQRSRNTLAENQVRLQQVLASISDTIYSAEFDDHHQVINHHILSPQLAQLTGYPISRFNADWYFWSSLVVPEDRPRVSAHVAGLRTGVSDEIEYRVRRVDGEIVWVRDSVHVEQRPGDPYMTVYGVISDVTARKQAEDKLRESERQAREFQEKLKALNRANIELSKASSLDDLHRRAVELGLSSLGFDRIGLWLLDPDQMTMIGAFGTDPQGEIRDEHGWCSPVADDPHVSEAINSNERILVWEDQPLYDRWTEKIGHGWNALATLWDGDQTIGWIAADNLIHQRPLYPYQRELLLLYGTVLGHLCTRLRAEEALRQAHGDLEQRVEERTLELAQVNAALSADRNLLRTLIDALPHAIYIKDTQSRFLGSNSFHTRFLGLDRPEDLIGKTDFDLYPREYAERFFADEQAIFRTGEPLINHEEPSLSPSGEKGWALATKVPLRDEAGNIIGLIGIGYDITERKLAEETVRKRAVEMQTVVEVGAAAASLLDPEQLLWKISNLTKERFGLYHAHVYLLDEAGEILVSAAGAGDAGRMLVAEEHHIALADEHSLVARAARACTSVVVNDVTQAPDFLVCERLPLTRSEMSIPLVAGERVIGVLDVQSDQVDRFTDEDTRIMTILASQLAVAVQNARLFAEISAAQARFRTLVDRAPEAILVLDADTGLFVQMSETAYRMFGLEPAQVEQIGVAALSPEVQPDGRPSEDLARDYLSRAAAGETLVFEWMHRDITGKEFPVEVRLIRLPATDRVLIRASLIDITERKQAEEMVRRAHVELERRVQARTAELSAANARLKEEIAERQQAEEALAAERNLLRILIDHLPDSVYVKDLEGRILLANQTDARFMGAAGPEDVVGKTDFDFHPPDLAVQYYADDREVIRSGEAIVDREEPLYMPGEGHKWVLTTKVPLRDGQGNVIGLVGIGHDITERKKAEEALRQSEERYSSLFDGVPATLYRTTPDGQFLDVNPAMAELIGFEDPADMQADNVTTFYAHPEDRDRWRALIEREHIVRDFELQVRRRDGSVIWVRDTARAVHDEAGNILYYEGTLKDVTAQKRAEEALRASEERLELALRGAEMGLWDWNLLIDQVVVDRRWADMLGYPLDEVNLHSIDLWENLVHPDDAAAARGALQAHLEGRTPFYESEYRLRAKSGEWEWILDRGKVVDRGDDGKPRRMTGTHLDITARKQAEAERERLLQQARTRAAELATVAEVSRQATTILNIDRLLATVADLIQENFDLYNVQIYLLDDKGKMLTLVAAPGEVGRHLVDQKLSIPLRSRQSLVARAARTQQCVVVNDVAQEPAYLSHPMLPDTRSEMAVPMIAGDTLIGVLNVEDDQLGRFGTEDVNIHTTLAAQVAIAIHNARLFTDNARRLAIIENSSSLVALADLKESPYRLAYINPAGLRMLGYQRSEEVLGQRLSAFYSAESLDQLRSKAIPVTLKEGVWRGESQLKRPDGTLIPVEMTLFTIPDEQGQPHHLATIVNDISERKRAEQELRQSEERLELALQGAELGLWDYTVQTGEAIFNQRWADMLGYTLDEIEPCIDTWHKLLHPDDAPGAIAALLDHLQGGTPFYESEHRLRAKSGEWKWILARGKVVERDESGQPLRATGTHLDITERKTAEAALHESQQMLQLVMENVPQAIFWKDRNLVYLGCNREFCQDAGAESPAEIVGKTDFDLPWRDQAEQYRAGDREVMETGVPKLNYEEPQPAPEGGTRWVRVSKVPLRNAEGRVVAVLGTSEDITERRRAEEALRRANRAYRVLSDCNQAMVRATDEASLLSSTCQIIADTGGYRMAWVGYVDADQGTIVRPVARAGHEAGYLDAILTPEMIGLGGPIVTVLQTSAPCAVRDIATDPAFAHWSGEALARGYASMVSLPLLADGQVFGVVNVYASQPDAFDPAEIALLLELAGDLAYGITVLRTRLERQRAEEQLRLSEANLSALIENTDDMVWSVDTDYRIITMNSSLKRMFLRSFGVELKPGMRTTDYLPVGDRDDRKMLYDLALQGERTIVERHYEYGDTPAFEVEMSFNPIVAADGTITGVSIFSRDVTQRKQNEEQLRQLNARLEKRNRELLTLHEIGRILTASLDLHEVCRVMYREVAQRLLGASSFFLALYDDATQTISCGYAVADEQEIDPASLPGVPLGQGPNSAAIRTREPQIVALPDVYLAETPPTPFFRIGDSREPRSGLYVPLISGNQVIGVLDFQHTAVGAFQETDLTLISILANQAAIAIQNARLFAAERDQRTLAEALRDTAAAVNQTLDPDRVMDRILENIKRVVPHDSASIMLIEDGMVYVVRHTGFAEQGVVRPLSELRFPVDKLFGSRRMTEMGQPVLIPDTESAPEWEYIEDFTWIRSYIGAPIRQGNRVIGVINLDSATSGYFTSQHAERLQAFADQAAIAIQNAQLFADAQRHAVELQEQAQRLALISRVSGHLAQTLDLTEIYGIMLNELQQALGASYAGLLLFEDQDVGRLVVDSHPAQQQDAGVLVPLKNNRSIDRVRETHKALVSTDVLNDPLFEAAWEVLRERGTHSLLVVPLVVGDEVIGTLGLDFTEEHVFTATECEIAETIVNQASVAIVKARLYEAERDQRVLAEALRDTAAAVNSTLDFDGVLDHILANVGRVAPYDAANLMLIEDGVARIARRYPVPQEPAEREWLSRVRLPVAEMVNLGYAVETGQPLAIADTHDYPGWIALTPTKWIRSHATAPILREDKVIGLLTLDSATPGFFTQVHAERLQTFADQVGIAIYNAQLFEDIQRHAAELEQRVQERTRQLEQRRLQLQAILDSIGEGVIYDEKLEAKYINLALTQLTGYSPGEFTGYLDLLRSSQHTEAEFAEFTRGIFEAVDHHGIWRGDLRLRRKDGSEFDAALTATQVRDAEGQTVGAVTVIRDISQEKALQAQKDRFIANASHELRTPLANVKTRLYLLQRQPEKAEQHLQILNRVADGMAELVESLLDVSRFQRGVIPLHRHEVVLQDIINDVVMVQQAETERKHIQLRAELYPEPLAVVADPQRMAQVVTNLVNNAINYTPEGGHIWVELEPDPDEPDRRVVMRVRDTGIGIKPGLLSQVFEPFFRANEDVSTGTGLGLTIAREIVKLHEGHIGVDSEVGKGSVFWVKLDRFQP